MACPASFDFVFLFFTCHSELPTFSIWMKSHTSQLEPFCCPSRSFTPSSWQAEMFQSQSGTEAWSARDCASLFPLRKNHGDMGGAASDMRPRRWLLIRCAALSQTEMLRRASRDWRSAGGGGEMLFIFKTANKHEQGCTPYSTSPAIFFNPPSVLATLRHTSKITTKTWYNGKITQTAKGLRLCLSRINPSSHSYWNARLICHTIWQIRIHSWFLKLSGIFEYQNSQ